MSKSRYSLLAKNPKKDLKSFRELFLELKRESSSGSQAKDYINHKISDSIIQTLVNERFQSKHIFQKGTSY